MKTLIFLMLLLLQSLFPQQDPLLKMYLEQSASSLNAPVQNTEEFFKKFINSDAAAASIDTAEIYYFDISFSSPLEFNLYSKQLNVNFNYIVADQSCNNSNRNGIMLIEKIERKPASGKEPEKLNNTIFALIPDKCSTTRFYNSQKEMFCDNKRQYTMETEEGQLIAEQLKVRIGVQLLPNSKVDHNLKSVPADKNYPIEINTEEYVLRCCIRSILIFHGEEILENFVSLK
jgi:hypothetical protein